MLPFTSEQFLTVFARYNEAIWPAQIAAYVTGAIAVVLLFRSGRLAGMATAAIVAGMWLWTGVVYHGLYFAAINPLALLFAALFVAQAALMLGYATRLRFAVKAGVPAVMGGALVAYAAILYPLAGVAAGHAYPATPTFGVTPCPVTLFTFGLLLVARPIPWALLAIPFLWSLIGGSAALLLGVPQDWPLLISGPLVVGWLWLARGARS